MTEEVRFTIHVDDETYWEVELSAYKGVMGINAREWYFDHRSGEHKPGRKGMRVSFNGRMVNDPLGNDEGMMSLPEAVIKSMWVCLEEAHERGY